MKKLTRREFFKGLAAGATVIGAAKVIPGFVEAELWKPKTISIPKPQIYTGALFEMDYATKNIRFVGNPKKGATVLELHRWLQEQADNVHWEDEDTLDITDRNPSLRVTDQIITLEDNWYIENAQYLKDGSIQQRGETWAGIRTVGTIEDDTVPFINGKPAIRPGHVNQCMKVQRGETVNVSTRTAGNTYSSFDIHDPFVHQGCNYAAIAESKDLFWNDPFNDPTYQIEKQYGPPKYKSGSSTAGQRMAWKGKI